MCLALPMKVIEVKGSTAVVEQESVSREVRVDFLDDVRPGEFVLVHTGIAIEKIDPEEAEETLRLIRIIADEVH